MENFINNFISKNEKQFKKYKEYLLENNWTTTKPVISKKEKTALEKDTEKQTARFSDLANELNDRNQYQRCHFDEERGEISSLSRSLLRRDDIKNRNLSFAVQRGI